MNNCLNSVIGHSSLVIRHWSFVIRRSSLALTLLAFALRVYRLDSQSYWIDEAWTLRFAHMPWAELWRWLSTEELHPPLYFPLMHLWVSLIGDTEFATRFVSAGVSLLAVPLTYRLGATLGDRRLGLIAALLMAVAPFQVWHGQDARNYAMLTTAAALSLWAFVSLWQGRRGWGWWLLYVIGTAWTVLSHYHGLAVVGVQGLWLLLTLPRRGLRPVLVWAGALLLSLLPLAAWLSVGPRLLASAHWLTLVPLAESFGLGAIAYSVGQMVPAPTAAWLTAPFVVFYLLGLLYAARRPRWGRWRGWEMLLFLLSATLAPNVAAWVFSLLRTPVYMERYLIPVQIAFLLAVAAGVIGAADGLARLARRHQPAVRAAAGLLSLLVLLGVSGWVLAQHYTNPMYAKEDWRGVVRTIEQFSQPGDAILLTGDGGEMLLAYYYRGDLPVYFNFNTPVPPPDDARRQLADITADHRRLWFTPYGAPIDPLLESWLAENSYPAWHSWIGRKRLALYGLQADDSRTEPLNAAIDPAGGGPTLLAATLPAGPTTAGDVLPLTLTWQTNAPLAADVQLSLRLVNPQGDVFAQSDWPPLPPASAWPPGQPLIDRRALWLPADVPPGDYLLQLVVYRPDTGQPLGQPVTLPNVTVTAAQITPPPDALAIPNFAAPANASIRHSPAAIQLVGHALPAGIQPGQELWLWLYWLANAPLLPDTGLRLTLSGGDETLTTDQPLAESVGPLTSWQPGQVRRAVYHLPTSPRFAGDSLEVRVAAAGQPDISVGQVRLQTRPHVFEPPAIASPLNVAFGDPPLITLLGFDANAIDNTQHALILYWQANSDFDTSYTVFVQLLNPAGQVVAQQDSQPLGGAAPTTTWLPGEILSDPYTLNLPPELPPGDYRLIAGLYDPVTGQRLLTASGADFVELPPVTVR